MISCVHLPHPAILQSEIFNSISESIDCEQDRRFFFQFGNNLRPPILLFRGSVGAYAYLRLLRAKSLKLDYEASEIVFAKAEQIWWYEEQDRRFFSSMEIILDCYVGKVSKLAMKQGNFKG
ncbi:uncharacterized protein LOC123888446 isoform X1 [Trifolium pratense]|uniref:uncharacterized protein LOC123888446 isoform X1 n=1 Tax=Trifolium pratense TaxID=57577 RepID=UPI001E69037B|nr:uncharacterized protein LOC123888446 isoform X1 [Trifolium pratense]